MRHPVRDEQDEVALVSVASNSVGLERGVQGQQWQDCTRRALYSVRSAEFIQEIMGTIEGF